LCRIQYLYVSVNTEVIEGKAITEQISNGRVAQNNLTIPVEVNPERKAIEVSSPR